MAVQETKEKIINPLAAIKENAVDGYNELRANRPEEQPIIEAEPKEGVAESVVTEETSILENESKEPTNY